MAARWLVRLPEELADKIDARAMETGLSRNAWVIKALSFLLDSDPNSGSVVGQRSGAPGESVPAKPGRERESASVVAASEGRSPWTTPGHDLEPGEHVHVWVGRVGDLHCKRCGEVRS